MRRGGRFGDIGRTSIRDRGGRESRRWSTRPALRGDRCRALCGRLEGAGRSPGVGCNGAGSAGCSRHRGGGPRSEEGGGGRSGGIGSCRGCLLLLGPRGRNGFAPRSGGLRVPGSQEAARFRRRRCPHRRPRRVRLGRHDSTEGRVNAPSLRGGRFLEHARPRLPDLEFRLGGGAGVGPNRRFLFYSLSRVGTARRRRYIR